MENDKIISDLASIKATLEHQGKEFHTRLGKLEENNELLYRLTVVSEQQTDMLKSQQIQNDKMTEALNGVNINLTKLNMGYDELNNDVKSIVARVDGMEEDFKLETSKGKFSLNDILMKYVNWWILLPTLIIGSWILFKLGL